MNVNYEPCFLVIDFCREVRKQNIQNNIRYEVDFDFDTGSQDRKDFMEWLNSRPDDREFFDRCYEGDEEAFFDQAVSEPDFAFTWKWSQPDKGSG